MGGRIVRTGALAILLCLGLVAAPAAGAQTDSGLDRARQWLDQQRKPNGSFDDGAFNPVDLTANAVMGEVAAGSTPAPTTLDWLRGSSAAGAYAAKGPGSAAKLALALESAGGDAGALLTAIERAEAGATFTGAAGDYDVSLAVLALRGGGRAVPAGILDGLAGRQLADGGWAFGKGQPSDTNTTAVALMALASGGRGDSPAAQRGVRFLDGQQFDSAGWGYDKRSKGITAMDANSTGLVLSALSALGIDQQSKAKAGVTPRDALLGLQVPAGGFAFDPTKHKAGTADQLATSQALVGLAGRSLPVEQPAAAPKQLPSPDDTSWILPAVVAAALMFAAGIALLVLRRRA